jgi:L-ascorbate metabolism protein UlaG (beta-lactamase superfamily)
VPAPHRFVLPAAKLAGDLDAVELTFIGTATTLLRVGGFTLLTDPNFLHAGEHAYLGAGIRSRRRLDPAMGIDELPPLDAVLLSHHHGDHFDHVAAERLDKGTLILTEPHAARKLHRQGFTRPVALRTWESAALVRDGRELVVTSMPGRHSPRLLGPLVPPVMGSMLDLREGGRRRSRTYVSGDTLLYDGIEQVVRRFPGVDLCVLHLGGTRIAGVLLTMDAGQGTRFLQLVAPSLAVPVHHDDYPVFKSSLEDFLAAAERAGVRARVRVVDRGETLRVPLDP